MGTVKNLSYFQAEDAKNRDVWKHGDGASRVFWASNPRKNNLYATGKFDDVIKYQAPSRLWKNSIGDLPPQDPHMFIDVLKNPNATKEQIQAALLQAATILAEYQRQLGVHQQSGAEDDAANVQKWIDGVLDATKQLTAKYALITGIKLTPIEDTGDPTLVDLPKPADTNTLPDEGLSSGMMWGIGIALALAIAIPLGVAYKNKNKGK